VGAAHEDPGVRLMLAFQAGQESAFEELVLAYQGAVFSMLRRLLGPHPMIEDLAQETFVRLYRARERYRPEGRLATFLFRITYNLALNRVRDDRRQETASLGIDGQGRSPEPQDGRLPPPGEALDRETWARRIEMALAALPENQRAALVFQHYDGLDLAEIGAILGISAKAVKSLLHRARENLRPILGRYRDMEGEER